MKVRYRMLEIYQKWYIDKDCEQKDLFRFLAARFGIRSVLYPGSFVHITPSFYIPEACYVDLDKRAKRFFQNLEQLKLEIRKSAIYKDPVRISFHPMDYTKQLPVQDASFDLLVSQYAGFVSKACKRYLKPDGLLLVNNSHGDAGIAALDENFILCGVFQRRKSRYVFSDKNLEAYFIPEKPIADLENHIGKLGRGVAYTKTATLYLFQKVDES